MELHENLYALGVRLGREVFDDPDSFRGALDDFLDEDSATTGDINLLVDAVRLGAFAALTSMLGSGAKVAAAIEEAGNRLARDRGSADVAGARWACAMLAFAIGVANDSEVLRYRTQAADPQPPTEMPPTQFADPSPTPADETQTGSSDPAVPGSAPASAGLREPAPPGPPGTSGRKRRNVAALVAAGAVLALAVGTVAVLTRDKEPDGSPDGSATAGPAELPMDLDSIQARYDGLATDVTVGVDACVRDDAGDRTTEVLECTFTDGTLTLTTFDSLQDLQRHRGVSTGTGAGARLSRTEKGAIYGIEASALSGADVPSLYWDSAEALQSGSYVGGSDSITLDQLVELYERVEGVITYPTMPEDEGMIALAKEFLDIDDCERVQNNDPGELEESVCDAPNDVFVYIGVFEDREDFEDYRGVRVDQGTGNPDERYWLSDSERQGAFSGYHVDGDAVLYWDRSECQCYMEATLESGDLKVLETWWAAPVE